mgnify:CR=1 FL=1
MIFIGFLLISGIFFVFAHFAGGVDYFINLDSFVIPLLGCFLFALFTFNIKAFGRGIKTAFMFSKKDFVKDPEVQKLYKALIFISLAIGVCSAFQGIICGILFNWRNGVEFPLTVVFSFASFTVVYGLMYAAFLFYPVYLMHKE